MDLTFKQLTGRDQSHLEKISEKHFLTPETAGDFRRLQELGKSHQFDMQLVSTYRSFDRQLIIWNEKAQGLRPILDDQGRIIDPRGLDSYGLLYAILRWSALPGLSRHHWGTDFDLFDYSRCSKDYSVQLTPDEWSLGPCAELNRWDEWQQSNFYRPFQGTGVGAEPWHFSHRSSAKRIRALLDKEEFRAFYETQDQLELKETILANFDTIFDEYFFNERYYQLA